MAAIATTTVKFFLVQAGNPAPPVIQIENVATDCSNVDAVWVSLQRRAAKLFYTDASDAFAQTLRAHVSSLDENGQLAPFSVFDGESLRSFVSEVIPVPESAKRIVRMQFAAAAPGLKNLPAPLVPSLFVPRFVSLCHSVV